MSSTLHHQGVSSQNNITSQTVVRAGAGRIVRIVVNTAGSTAGSVNDSATTGGVAAANLIANIPNTLNVVVSLDWPIFSGIVITPGTGQVLSISYT